MVIAFRYEISLKESKLDDWKMTRSQGKSY